MGWRKQTRDYISRRNLPEQKFPAMHQNYSSLEGEQPVIQYINPTIIPPLRGNPIRKRIGWGDTTVIA